MTYNQQNKKEEWVDDFRERYGSFEFAEGTSINIWECQNLIDYIEYQRKEAKQKLRKELVREIKQKRNGGKGDYSAGFDDALRVVSEMVRKSQRK
jgi:hypothetical protein